MPPSGIPSLVVTPVAAGLATPWDIAFAPDGTMLFTERVGRIDAWIGGAKRVLATPSDVKPMSESGMMGLAVDPAFASNRRIYTCFISNAGGPTDIRIARWVVDPTWTSLGSRTDILTGLPVNQSGQMGRHGGCRLRFGPDANLWVTVGDSATGSVPQDPHSFGGKVLRITTSGAAASGNPGGALLPQIYTYGHRNPQGVAFRPSDGQAFSVEHGTGCDDEVNVLHAGANYGWDPGSTGSGYDENTSMTDLVRFRRPPRRYGPRAVRPSPLGNDVPVRLAVGRLERRLGSCGAEGLPAAHHEVLADDQRVPRQHRHHDRQGAPPGRRAGSRR